MREQHDPYPSVTGEGRGKQRKQQRSDDGICRVWFPLAPSLGTAGVAYPTRHFATPVAGVAEQGEPPLPQFQSIEIQSVQYPFLYTNLSNRKQMNFLVGKSAIERATERPFCCSFYCRPYFYLSAPGFLRNFVSVKPRGTENIGGRDTILKPNRRRY